MGNIDGCRICGAALKKRFEINTAQYGRCIGCGALLKILSEKEYHALEISYDPDPIKQAASREQMRDLLDVKDKIKFWRKYAPDFGKGTRFLDIGCGEGGQLMATTEIGWKACGLEPSVTHSQSAKDLGFSVINDYLNEGIYDPASFDVVLLSHVIEHILVPNHFLEVVMQLVRPGGRVVIVTPNAAYNAAKLCGPNWMMLQPIDHVSLLTQESFKEMDAIRRHQIHFATSEYSSEPLVTLLAALKGRFKPSKIVDAESPKKGISKSAQTLSLVPKLAQRLSGGLIDLCLKLLSLPWHIYNISTNNQACLVVCIDRTEQE